jgi:hypothetical protein
VVYCGALFKLGEDGADLASSTEATKEDCPEKGFQLKLQSKLSLLFLACLFLSSLDALSTLLALTSSKGYERNAVLALLLSHLGYPALLLWMPVEALAVFTAIISYRRFRLWLLGRWMRRRRKRRWLVLLRRLAERYEWARRLASKIDERRIEEVERALERAQLQAPLEFTLLVAPIIAIVNNFMIVLK